MLTICPHDTTEIRDAVEPTTESDGYTGDTYCTACGRKIADGKVIQKSEPSRLVGDVNGDGIVNAADAQLITRRLAGWDVTFK